MTDKKLQGAGLRGQSAGETALCTVGKTGSGLTYRGYDIKVLAEKAKFEEIAFLLIYGKLPNSTELENYKNKLCSLREIPEALKQALELIPAESHPMDVMRTGCSVLGNLETEIDFSEQFEKADRIVALLPSIITYWYRFSHQGVRINTSSVSDSIAGHFLSCLHDEEPSALRTTP